MRLVFNSLTLAGTLVTRLSTPTGLGMRLWAAFWRSMCRAQRWKFRYGAVSGRPRTLSSNLVVRTPTPWTLLLEVTKVQHIPHPVVATTSGTYSMLAAVWSDCSAPALLTMYDLFFYLGLFLYRTSRLYTSNKHNTFNVGKFISYLYIIYCKSSFFTDQNV